MATHLRILQVHDADELFAIEQECFAQFWTKKLLQDELEHHAQSCFGAYEGEELVGYILCRITSFDAWLMRMGVKKSRQRLGIANLLLQAASEKVQGTPDGFWLEVAENNLPAIALYEKHGFVEISRRKNYYDAGVTAIVMRRRGNN